MSAAKRFLTRETAQIEVYGHVGLLVASLRNLSETGAFLEVAKGDYVPKKGDLLNMTVNLDTLDRIHNVAAEVVWSKGMGLGICFINRDQVLERMMAKSSSF
ncbi:PilZ domain-containing protein [Bdellovibrio bacteriovorus]|uniref:PilZ domain-containing protein n=1 Tax=Bdellovibrio reynosensis TaxID=2835041 RepID=A0ABY4C7V9_9BACT|nr:PilZ domain-containing protein [Bdellovibrio reynosensis]UOF01017.1 PilZ domain-containing protein [Bdellovibrio reynosensis]